MLDINSIDLSNYKFTVKSTEPWIIIIHNFLSDQEIDSLIKSSENRFKRSFVVGHDDSHSIHDKRTSSTCMFTKSETTVLASLENRVARITKLDVNYQEPFQLVKYEINQQYAPHFDFFDVSEPYANNEVILHGQRCMTILAYLTEPISGGSTFFPHASLHVSPKKGSAVLWFNTDKEGNVDKRTEHGGMPVLSGTKIAMNIWIRDKHYN